MGVATEWEYFYVISLHGVFGCFVWVQVPRSLCWQSHSLLALITYMTSVTRSLLLVRESVTTISHFTDFLIQVQHASFIDFWNNLNNLRLFFTCSFCRIFRCYVKSLFCNLKFRFRVGWVIFSPADCLDFIHKKIILS